MIKSAKYTTADRKHLEVKSWNAQDHRIGLK